MQALAPDAFLFSSAHEKTARRRFFTFCWQRTVSNGGPGWSGLVA
jgi:hypothetical protein